MLPLSLPLGLCLVMFLWQLQLFPVLPSQMYHPCLPQENATLLHFKSLFSIDQEASDDCPNSYPKTESWKQGTDCCNSWDGVRCDDADGHVTGLDLSCSSLLASVPFTNTSVVGLHLLPRLRILSLAFNDFSGSQISSNISHLRGLEYLNLSYSSFYWKVPPDFSSLSNLVALDLSGSFNRSLKLDTNNFRILVSNLTKLEQLGLSFSDMSSVNFASPINFTTSLRSLMIHSCNLRGHIPPLDNLTKLSHVDFSSNDFVGEEILSYFSTFRQLNVLDLFDNHFSGSIPVSLGNLTKLTLLNFSFNNLSGQIPDKFSNLTEFSVSRCCRNWTLGLTT